MRFVVDDGGRAAAGYKGLTGDCVTRAIAIAAQLPYQQVYDALNETARKHEWAGRSGGRSDARRGVHKQTIARYMKSIGWEWTPTMFIGSGCTVHLRAEELPPGRLVVSVSRHITSVINGVVHDTYDPTREGMRCVYGYWRKA